MPHYISSLHQQREARPCFLLLLMGLGPALTSPWAETQVGAGSGRKLTQPRSQAANHGPGARPVHRGPGGRGWGWAGGAREGVLWFPGPMRRELCAQPVWVSG